MSAGKDVENRSRPTKHRGRLYIHAGKAWDKDAPALIHCLTRCLPVASLVQGMVIGTVDVIDCHHSSECQKGTVIGSFSIHSDSIGSVEHCSQWAMPDHYHWVLANPRPLACPFPEKGKLGIWDFGEKP